MNERTRFFSSMMDNGCFTREDADRMYHLERTGDLLRNLQGQGPKRRRGKQDHKERNGGK